MAMGGAKVLVSILAVVFLLFAGSEASYSAPSSSSPTTTYTPTDPSPVTSYPTAPYSGNGPTTDTTPTVPDTSVPATPIPDTGSSPTQDAPTGTPYSATPTPADGSSSSPVTLPPVTIPDTPTPVTVPDTPSPVTYTPTPSGSSGFKPRRSGRGTCRYWKSNTRRFPNIISILTTIARIFGGISGSRFGSSMTVVDALTSESNDAYSSLARHAVASLLNSYTVADFTYSPEQVRAQFNQALATPESAAQQALLFERANELI